METGAAVAAAVGVDPVVDAEWDEQSFGDWDGRSIEELVAGERDAMRALRDDAAYRPPGGESHDDLVARVVPAWERVRGRRAAPASSSATASRSSSCSRTCSACRTTAPGGLAAAPGSLTAVEVWDDGEVSVAFTNRT